MLSLLYFSLIGIALWISRGMFELGALSIMTLGTILFMFSNTFGSYRENWVTGLTSIATGLFIFLLIVEPRIMYAPREFPMLASYLAIRAVLGLALLLYLLSLLLPARMQVLLLMGVAALLLYTYLLVIAAVPLPQIDVFVVDSLSADALLAGKNPYTQPYPDLYNGAYGYAASFTYWPGLLLFTIPTRLIGDIRFGSILSVLICSLCLYILNRTEGRNIKHSISTSLLLLSFPVGLFVLEQAWIDPILAALACMVATLFQRKQWLIAAVLLGVTMATKQYGFLIAAPSIAYIFRAAGWKNTITSTLCMGAIAVSILAPFAIWDFHGFSASTIALHINVPNRPDSLSFPAAFFAITETWPSSLLLLVVYLAALGAGIFFLIKKPKCTLYDWAFTVTAIHAIIFLFGKQAFCNYYYLLATFALLLFSLRPRPPKFTNV